jgi:hypothetical protein
LLRAPPEARFDPIWHRSAARRPEASGESLRRQLVRQLEQRERIAARLGKDPRPHTPIQRSGEDRREQLLCGDVREAFDPQIGKPDQLLEPAGLAL